MFPKVLVALLTISRGISSGILRARADVFVSPPERPEQSTGESQ